MVEIADISKNDTHKKGLLGELEFVLYFIRLGWKVYKPFDQNSKADLVIEKDKVFKKIQIKYCTPYKGCLRVELEHPKGKTKPYSLDDIDEIGVFDSRNRKFYLIPLTEILPKKEIWIRVTAPKNFQKKKINDSKKYLI